MYVFVTEDITLKVQRLWHLDHLLTYNEELILWRRIIMVIIFLYLSVYKSRETYRKQEYASCT